MIKKKEIKEEVRNEKVAELLSILRDENYANEDQRKKMIDILTSLFNIRDKDARLIFKKLGQALTDIGNEMLTTPDEEEIADEGEIEEVDPIEVVENRKKAYIYKGGWK